MTGFNAFSLHAFLFDDINSPGDFLFAAIESGWLNEMYDLASDKERYEILKFIRSNDYLSTIISSIQDILRSS